MSKKIGKIAISLFLFCVVLVNLFACKKEVEALSDGEENIVESVNENQKYGGKVDETIEPPNLDVMKTEPNLDFDVMHNYVIDTLTSEYTPFFFVKEGKLDISGNNDDKSITLTCTCFDKTTVEDVDLFISYVLNCIGYNAAEQDFRFTIPKVDSTGTYLDFGSVFNTYDLYINADTEDGTILRKEHIKAGGKMPVDSRYWSE